jgi:hypothetical protein
MGAFEYSFKPSQGGNWSAQAYYIGTGRYADAVSEILTFSVEKNMADLTITPFSTKVKAKKSIDISGNIDPPLEGVLIRVVYSGPDHEAYNIKTDSSGNFETSHIADKEGNWDILAKIEDERFEYAQSNLISVEVLPLTIIDNMISYAKLTIQPPFLYVTIAIIGIIIFVVYWRYLR